MSVLGPIGDEHQHPRAGEHLDQAIEHLLGRAVDPVEILEHEEEGSRAALLKQEALNTVERPLASLSRFRAAPVRVVERHAHQIEERRKGRRERGVNRLQPPRDGLRMAAGSLRSSISK